MKNYILSNLNVLRNKGAAWQSQTKDKGINLIIKLKESLHYNEYQKLKIAHSHYLTGEGSDEFYDVCNELIEKYKLLNLKV